MSQHEDSTTSTQTLQDASAVSLVEIEIEKNSRKRLMNIRNNERTRVKRQKHIFTVDNDELTRMKTLLNRETQ